MAVNMTAYNNKFNSIKDKMQALGSSIASTPKTLTAIDDGLDSISAGGGSSDTASIFSGWTMPLTYKNSLDKVFEYKSSYTINITGLSGKATISGNNSNAVTVTFIVTGSTNTVTPFTITCSKDSETLVFKCIAFHYGTELGAGKCLAVARTINWESPRKIAYNFIESTSLPLFISDTTQWNGVLSYQIVSFTFGKWVGTSIGASFLSICYSFNQPLTIPSTVQTISSWFTPISYNHPLTIPDSVTSIGDNFMNNCPAFNQKLILSNNLVTIGSNFLYNDRAFNQPLTITNKVTTIGQDFMANCYGFNQPLIIGAKLNSIGTQFMLDCRSFNQEIIIPSTLTNLTNNFMSGCSSFNQELTIPSTVTSVGTSFMHGCFALMHLIYNTNKYPSGEYSLSQVFNTKTGSSGTGILISGTYASGLKSALPDRSSTPFRKLIQG